MSDVTLGGDRLGSGGNQKIHLRNFERSTHDIGFLWKSTMMPGALTPFMSEVALPGDTHDIFIDCDILTLPTKGPLFGKFKFQCDVFSIPMRLYNARLHMNELGIGMKMSEIHLPQVRLIGKQIDTDNTLGLDLDNYHTNPSSLMAYLNIRGCGSQTGVRPTRYFTAVDFLGYWDIYKQYYSNKQEEVGYAIHTQVGAKTATVPLNGSAIHIAPDNSRTIVNGPAVQFDFSTAKWELTFTNPANDVIITDDIIFEVSTDGVNATPVFMGANYLDNRVVGNVVTLDEWDSGAGAPPQNFYIHNILLGTNNALSTRDDRVPSLRKFDLNNIDAMREKILKWFDPAPYVIDGLNGSELAPYLWAVEGNDPLSEYSVRYDGNGLGIKTYQSDLFNNWISTEWIDGEDGISAITAVDVSSGSLIIDELNLARKVYDMLNRIAVSGGSYDDWLDAVYTHERQRAPENPVFEGGLSQILYFQEIRATADTRTEVQTQGEPLGTLAGTGRLGGDKKGGKIVIKTSEPSVILGICSLTPILDYSQGNKWDKNLKTMDDLHKPNLDQIGFQDLITDQMAWFDTFVDDQGVTTYYSAGKQPAWINYMTNVNITRGNFAKSDDQMFMTLNRRYTNTTLFNEVRAADITTYIDPAKFNYIFADARLNAQNFWVQLAVNITARRKMSAKVMPNL